MAAAAVANDRATAVQQEARERVSGGAGRGRQGQGAPASFDAELCEATRRATYAEAVVTDVVSCATAVKEKIASLEGELQEAIRASHRSEAAEARGQLL